MKIEKIKKYLDDNKIKFEEIAHKTVYTAHDAAKTLKTKMSEIGKPVVIKADGQFVLVLVPADKDLDMKKLKKKLGAKKIEIVSEKAMAKALKLKKEAIGAFGKLRELQVYVDKNVLKNKKVVLATSDFTKSIKMAVKDFVKLEEAVVEQFTKTKKFKKVKKVVDKKVGKAKSKVRQVLKKVPITIKTTNKKKVIKKAVKKVVKKKVVKKVDKKKPVKKVVKKKVAKKKVAKKKTAKKK